MQRLALALGLGLAYVFARHLLKPSPNGFRFPTRASHAAISLDAGEIDAWCKRFGCSEHSLRTATSTVGMSEHAVRDYFARHYPRS